MKRLAAALVALVLPVASCGGDLELSSTPAPADAGPEAASAKPACRTDDACGGLHCDLGSGACVACTTDAHCRPDNRRCDAALHRCVECGLSADCESGEACQPETRRCVPTCADGGVCPSGAPICDPQRGICLECRVDTDCKEDERAFCDAASGRCLACRTDSDCVKREEPLCDPDGACVACRTSLDCPAEKPVCNPTDWECKGP